MPNIFKTYLETLAGMAVLSVILAFFAHLSLAALETESQWRQDRFCKYYSAEIEYYAIQRGEDSPC